MALLVLLISADEDEISLGAKNVEALARLGVTSFSLARDEHTAAVILEGWALDPASHGAALAALGASTKTARALQPVIQMAVSTAVTLSGGSSP
jgi:hypothetical protein